MYLLFIFTQKSFTSQKRFTSQEVKAVPLLKPHCALVSLLDQNTPLWFLMSTEE